ncbi:contactin-5-like isoform X1 [Biomphalaria glabrata]|uniref:Contactin-5-like isoform X1 n=2 Tax=Biomphalaria glabrata TaxID=6526 RepID=A0A9W2YE21_BIOGL|nr:contactin-5-like isoform X1 [Biomphalaria glabrata]
MKMWIRCRFVFQFLLVQVVICQIQYDCPTGWVEQGSTCYNFHYYPSRSYSEASIACQVDGAYLLSINNPTEFGFISDWLTQHDQNRGNQWWTSGVGGGANFRWEGDGTTDAPLIHYWADESEFTSLLNGDVAVYAFHSVSGVFKWTRARREAILPYICEISTSEAYRVIQQDRDHMFGTNLTDPNEIKRGPTFLVQPQTTVIVGEVAQTYIECIAQSNPQPIYVWYKKVRNDPPVLVTSDDHYIITNGKFTITQPTEWKDEGSYQCQAQNELGTILSDPVDIYFGYLFEFSNDPPGSVTAFQYKGTVMNCKAPAYNPAIDIKWYKEDGGPNFLRTDLHPHLFVSMNGHFYISESASQDGGFYHCVVALMPPVGQIMSTSQPPSRTSLGIELIIKGDSPSDYGPEIHNDFPAVFPTPALRGDTLTLECFAYGKLPLYYSWRKDNGPIPSKSQYSEHNRVITLPNAELEDAGNYTCQVDRGNSAKAEKSINVKIEAKPFFIFPLKDQHIDIDRQFTWRCEARGIPQPVYHWYKNGVLITAADTTVEVKANVLKIAQAQPLVHQGMYQCSASNIHGTVFTSAQLRVLAFKPSFRRRPLNPTQLGTEGGSLTFICQPEAAPAPTITWKKDNVPLTATDPDGRIVQLPNGNLFMKDLQRSDSGTYECTATNSLGSDSSRGVLTVSSKTVMTVKPSNTQVQVNATAFLRCQASYDEAQKDMVYVWDLNGRPINYAIEPHYVLGTQTSLTGLYITNAQVYHTGTYGCSAVTSDDSVRHTAYLQVFGPPGECGGVIAKITDRDATIKWALGPTNMAEITKFRIEFNTNFNETWRMLKDDIAYVDAVDHNREGRCIYDVPGLKPGSSYRFRIIAYNRYGAGPPSLPSSLYKVPDAAPVAMVTGIREGWGPVGILALEWDLLAPEDLTGNDVGYKIYYRKKSTSLDAKWNLGEVFEENKYAATVGADNYYLEYEVKIAGFNSIGHGPNSSVVIIMSQADMPLGAATQVYVESYNATALVVRWTPIPLLREYIRGRVVGYGINYWRPGEGMDSSNMYCYDDCGSEILVGLEPDSYYWVNVQVFTTAGMGTLSEDAYGKTFGSQPHFYPKYVHVNSYKGNAVFVLWKGVSNARSEEPIIGYKLRWWPSTEDIRKANITVIAQKKTTAVIHGIRKGIVYSLRVMAYSNGGDGVSSPTTYFTLEGQVMFNPETTDILNAALPTRPLNILLLSASVLCTYLALDR